MHGLLFLIIFCSLCLGPASASAWDVLAVQNSRAKPYSEAVEGFVMASGAKVQELIISELDGEDVAVEVRRRKPDLILAVGMEALMKVKKIREKPIVYMMVLNPDSVLRGESNIFGVGMLVPPEKQLTYFRRALPRAERIGVIFNPAATGQLVSRASSAAARTGIEIKALKAEKASDFPTLLKRMKGNIDAYWMLPDSTVLTSECLEYLLLFSMENRVPIFTFSSKYLKMGAFLSVEVSPFRIGKQAGEIAQRIKAGSKAADMREVEMADAEVTVNLKVADKIGVAISNQFTHQFRAMK